MDTPQPPAWADSDRFAIRYLDGTTTASPIRSARSPLARAGDDGTPTGPMLAALSNALDLTEGQLPGHSLRTCFLALRVADALGLSVADRAGLFNAALLKDAGCSSNAAAVTRIFGGEDQLLKGRQATVERSMLDYVVFAIRNLPRDEPLPARLRRLIHLGIRGKTEQREVEQIRCERGASIARKAGFGDAVGRAVHDVHEHWDGRGQPRGLRGDAIDPLARIIAACQGLDIFHSTRGRVDAVRVVARRRGTWYDPDVATALLELCETGLLDELRAPDVLGRTMDLRPDIAAETADASSVDRIAEAFADIVDAKSPYTGAHSRNVALIAERLALRLGLPAGDTVTVRRAALLHDLGKLGVPNTILDKPGRLDPAERAVIERHPQLTLEILAPIPTFQEVAELAACHHERLDGTGYFRGLAASTLGLGARIVSVADVWDAITADRPYRAAIEPERAMAIMRDATGDHLAGEVVRALVDDLDVGSREESSPEPAPTAPTALTRTPRASSAA